MIAVCLALCLVSALKIQKTKLLSFLSVKGLAILSILVFAIVCSNLASNMDGATLFVIIAIALQVFSAVVSCLPAKDNLFEPLYKALDMATSLCLALAGLLIVPLSPFGLPAGFVVGAIASAMFALFKREFKWNVDLFAYFGFAFATALLGQIVVILISSITLQTILFSAGALVFFVSTLFKTFISSDRKSILITKNILYYISLIAIASSIFLAVV